MTKTRLIGDIHGLFYDYQLYSIGGHDGPTIQLGDFGIGFAGPYWHNRVNEFHETGNHRFIRGNHDNLSKCKNMIGWIPDGTVEGDVMFIGGAWSIDWGYRTPSVDWWEDEQCSLDQFDAFIDVYKTVKPRVMITHDAPIDVTDKMFIQRGLALGGPNAKQIPNLTNIRFQQMFDIHKPDYWFFGHWHETATEYVRGTRFVCLGELDTIDVDLSDSRQISKDIVEKFGEV